MNKRCQVCGKRIRSGHKYCYKHRKNNNRRRIEYGRKNSLHKSMVQFFIFGLISFLSSYVLFRNISILPSGFNQIAWILLLLGFVCFYLFYQNQKKLSRKDMWNFNPKNFIGFGGFLFAIGMIIKSMTSSSPSYEQYLFYSYIMLTLSIIIILIGVVAFIKNRDIK